MECIDNVPSCPCLLKFWIHLFTVLQLKKEVWHRRGDPCIWCQLAESGPLKLYFKFKETECKKKVEKHCFQWNMIISNAVKWWHTIGHFQLISTINNVQTSKSPLLSGWSLQQNSWRTTPSVLLPDDDLLLLIPVGPGLLCLARNSHLSAVRVTRCFPIQFSILGWLVLNLWAKWHDAIVIHSVGWMLHTSPCFKEPKSHA